MNNLICRGMAGFFIISIFVIQGLGGSATENTAMARDLSAALKPFLIHGEQLIKPGEGEAPVVISKERQDLLVQGLKKIKESEYGLQIQNEFLNLSGIKSYVRLNKIKYSPATAGVGSDGIWMDIDIEADGVPQLKEHEKITVIKQFMILQVAAICAELDLERKEFLAKIKIYLKRSNMAHNVPAIFLDELVESAKDSLPQPSVKPSPRQTAKTSPLVTNQNNSATSEGGKWSTAKVAFTIGVPVALAAAGTGLYFLIRKMKEKEKETQVKRPSLDTFFALQKTLGTSGTLPKSI